MTTTDECISHLMSSRQIRVTAVTMCGSHRQGTTDEHSDRDLWVFCDDDQPISDHLATTAFIPLGARREVLFEGRDDTLTDHAVVNVLTQDEVLNLKFLHTSVLTRFCGQPPVFDVQYVEDLENYLTMHPLHDPHGIVADHRTWLTIHARDTMNLWLIPQALQRYGSTYWRSVYQGVLREEVHAWRHLATHLVELLTWTAFALRGDVPPPRKWLFSPRLLQQLPQGAQILRALEALGSTTAPGRLHVYEALAPLEDAILPAAGESAMWWRNVFTQRLPHLARHLNRADITGLVAAAPAPRRAA
ncbi:hypothetical protein [Streptomyces sp. NPDC048350]|uniref:hypothetical protein n=1 Tax=Streptomyces sp. NPDC048350 TaxID=3365538 RepID=UPI003721AA68